MDNLNKENFFNRMEELYPEAMADFKEWIDAYKLKVDWDDIFNGNQIANEDTGERFKEIDMVPKFHDIPFEMQLGIIIAYASERVERKPNDTFTIDVFKEVLPDMFQLRQSMIIKEE